MHRTTEDPLLFAVVFTAMVALGALIGLLGYGPAGTDAGARIGAVIGLSVDGIWAYERSHHKASSRRSDVETGTSRFGEGNPERSH